MPGLEGLLCALQLHLKFYQIDLVGHTGDALSLSGVAAAVGVSLSENIEHLIGIMILTFLFQLIREIANVERLTWRDVH